MRPISAKSTVGTNSPFTGRSANFQKKFKFFIFSHLAPSDSNFVSLYYERHRAADAFGAAADGLCVYNLFAFGSP